MINIYNYFTTYIVGKKKDSIFASANNILALIFEKFR